MRDWLRSFPGHSRTSDSAGVEAMSIRWHILDRRPVDQLPHARLDEREPGTVKVPDTLTRHGGCSCAEKSIENPLIRIRRFASGA